MSIPDCNLERERSQGMTADFSLGCFFFLDFLDLRRLYAYRTVGYERTMSERDDVTQKMTAGHDGQRRTQNGFRKLEVSKSTKHQAPSTKYISFTSFDGRWTMATTDECFIAGNSTKYNSTMFRSNANSSMVSSYRCRRRGHVATNLISTSPSSYYGFFCHRLLSSRFLSACLSSWAFTATTINAPAVLAFTSPSLALRHRMMGARISSDPLVHQGRGGLRFSQPPRNHPPRRQFATNHSDQEEPPGEKLINDDEGSISSRSTGGSSAVLSQRPLPTDSPDLQMISFYHFEPIPDPWASRNQLFESIRSIPGLRGTIYIAHEGVNAQLAVPPGDPLDQLLAACSTSSLPFDPFPSSLENHTNNEPNLGDVVPISTPTFNRLIVRVRDYVLRDGIEPSTTRTTALDWTNAGAELSPGEWHRELSKDVSSSSSSSPILLDCRNLYESEQGTFQGAIPLETQNFQESWPLLTNLTKELPKDQPLHIFCTGGIRCVKVGAYLQQELGFKNVKRLQHGIIGYQQWMAKNGIDDDDDDDDDDEATAKNTTNTESLWQGENFLFDKRRFADDMTTPTSSSSSSEASSEKDDDSSL